MTQLETAKTICALTITLNTLIVKLDTILGMRMEATARYQGLPVQDQTMLGQVLSLGINALAKEVEAEIKDTITKLHQASSPESLTNVV